MKAGYFSQRLCRPEFGLCTGYAGRPLEARTAIFEEAPALFDMRLEARSWTLTSNNWSPKSGG